MYILYRKQAAFDSLLWFAEVESLDWEEDRLLENDFNFLEKI